MTISQLLNAAGRRRSPLTLPGYLAGCPPRNKGLRYPPDPPTVEEIVAVVREAGDGARGARMRALIVLLWRAGLRINEALTVTEHDLEPRVGSVLVRHGKGGRRREVGMDPWGWDHLRPRLELRLRLPVGPLLCVIDGTNPRAALGERRRPRPTPTHRRQGRCAAKVRAPPAAPRPRRRTRTRGRAVQRHPAPIGSYQPRRHLHLSPGDRQCRDHRHRPRPKGTDDPRQHRTPHLSRSTAASLAVAPVLLASIGSTVRLRSCCSSFISAARAPGPKTPLSGESRGGATARPGGRTSWSATSPGFAPT